VVLQWVLVGGIAVSVQTVPQLGHALGLQAGPLVVWLVALTQLVLLGAGAVSVSRRHLQVVLISSLVSLAVGGALSLGAAFEQPYTTLMAAGAVMAAGSTVAACVLFSVRHRLRIILESRERFLASLSHEIRTPLCSLIGHSRSLEFLKIAPVLKTTIRHIQTAGEHLRLVLDSVFEVSELEPGLREPAVRECSVAETANELYEEIAKLSALSGVTCHFACLGVGGARIRTDRRRLVLALTTAAIGLLRQLPAGERFKVSVRWTRSDVLFAVGRESSVEVVESGAVLPAPMGTGRTGRATKHASAVRCVTNSLLEAIGHELIHVEEQGALASIVRVPFVAARAEESENGSRSATA
jgi:hypothetical protein